MWLLGVLLLGLSPALAVQWAVADFYESFLEPNRSVDLAPPQRELIQTIHVSEGQFVERDTLLVSFDSSMVQAQLEIARVMAEAQGRINSSQVVVEMQQNHLTNLEELDQTGHVRPKELTKARSDLAIAQAELLAAREERSIRQAEMARIVTQLQRKELRAPFAGIILQISKEPGELFREHEEEPLLTIIKKHPLRANFYLPEPVTRPLEPGREVQVRSGIPERLIGATVEFVSPVVDPQSGTVLVRVLLAEQENLTSGMRCTLEIKTHGMDEQQ